jgi:hypothetical protein
VALLLLECPTDALLTLTVDPAKKWKMNILAALPEADATWEEEKL